MSAETTRSRRGEDGFALVLALLALMLLTFLGLTLATTTSTELQIATNYRWSQQALYNAEAGMEAAKVYLRNVPGSWVGVLPPARGGVSWDWNDGNAAVPATPALPAGLPAADAQGRALRNWENSPCDARGGTVGYGVVMHDPGAAPVRGPFQYVTSTLGQTLNGSFTLWVRRDVAVDPLTGQVRDDPNDNAVILTVEGVAPYTDAQMSGTLGRRNAAVRTLEVVLLRAASNETCESYRAQAGGAVSGAGFWNCVLVGQGCGAASAAGASLGNAVRGTTQDISGNRVTTDDAGDLCDTGVR